MPHGLFLRIQNDCQVVALSIGQGASGGGSTDVPGSADDILLKLCQLHGWILLLLLLFLLLLLLRIPWLALAENLLKGSDFTEEHVGIVASQGSIGADIFCPKIIREQSARSQ